MIGKKGFILFFFPWTQSRTDCSQVSNSFLCLGSAGDKCCSQCVCRGQGGHGQSAQKQQNPPRNALWRWCLVQWVQKGSWDFRNSSDTSEWQLSKRRGRLPSLYLEIISFFVIGYQTIPDLSVHQSLPNKAEFPSLQGLEWSGGLWKFSLYHLVTSASVQPQRKAGKSILKC